MSPMSLSSLMASDTTNTNSSPPPEMGAGTVPPVGGMSLSGLVGGATSAPPQLRATSTPAQPAVPNLTAPPTRFEDVAKDIVEGAVAPFTGSWEAAMGLLADPMFKVLPLSEQDKHLNEAERLGWKGAAFWGSMAVGGPVAKLPIAMVWRMAAAGAATGGAFASIEGIPELLHGYEDRSQYVKNVATTAAFGALTGGALSVVPGAIRVGAKAAQLPLKGMNRAIDLIPGGKAVRAKTADFAKTAFGHLWQPGLFTSGEEVMKGAGLTGLVDQLKAARTIASLKASELVAGMHMNLKGLSTEEVQKVTFFIENFDFTDPLAWDTAQAYTTTKADERLFAIAEREANRLIGLGRLMETAGMQVYDPEDNAFHRFALRKNYIPHRFVNHEVFLEGGEARDRAMQILMKPPKGSSRAPLSPELAGEWLDNFAQRIKSSNEGTFEGKFPAGTSGHYLIGRGLGLPGYETDLTKILPQYYEHVGRRLTNHVLFGPDPIVEAAQAAAEEAPGGKLPPEAAIVQPATLETVTERKAQPAKSMWQIIYERKQIAERAARQAQSIEFKYPKAFAQLESVADPEKKRLVTNVLRGQLGMIEQPQFGKRFLDEAANLQVVTKLALGAIAQPSQMLSAVVRTGWRGSFRDFMAFVQKDPEILDLVARSGATLRGVVRESQRSLTSQESTFLDKVLFTRFDVASRAYGAIRGASFADFTAKDLVRYNRQLEQLRMGNQIGAMVKKSLGGEKFLLNKIGKLEQKFVQLGIDPRAVVNQGGTLTNDQLLLAANRVTHDVNFWGDALSLPAFYRSAYGKYLTQFKSFGFQQTKLIKDTVVKPFMAWVDGKPHGDPGPLMRFALLMPSGGEAISDLKAIARARERPRDAIERIAENISNASGFGLAADAIRATDFGVSGTLGLIDGPILGDVGKFGAAVGELRHGKPGKMGRFGVEFGVPAVVSKTLPGAAPLTAMMTPAISNVLFPKKEKPQ